MKDFTIIVQGPYSPIFLPNLPNYLSSAYVNIVVWDKVSMGGKNISFNPAADIQHSIDKFNKEYSSRTERNPRVNLHIEPTIRDRTLFDANLYNPGNCYRQFFLVKKALEQVGTEYVIKVRTDEYYTDLSPVMEKIVAGENKLVSTSTYFRKPEIRPWHPSDHVFGCKTEHMKRIVNKCLEFCENGGWFSDEDTDRFKSHIGGISYIEEKKAPSDIVRFVGPPWVHITPEQIIGMSHLLLSDIDEIDFKHRKSIMKSFFDIVSVKQTAPFLTTCSHNGQREIHHLDLWEYSGYEEATCITESFDEIDELTPPADYGNEQHFYLMMKYLESFRAKELETSEE